MSQIQILNHGTDKKKKIKPLINIADRRTFRLTIDVLVPSILMMHFAVKSFSLEDKKQTT